jgi:hypothetical protein
VDAEVSEPAVAGRRPEPPALRAGRGRRPEAQITELGAITQVVHAEQVAEAAAWSAVTPQAAGEVFNGADGDPARRWQLWPAFADDFGMPAGAPRPIPLSSFMPGLA